MKYLSFIEKLILNQVLNKIVYRDDEMALFRKLYDVREKMFYEDNHFTRAVMLRSALDVVITSKEP